MKKLTNKRLKFAIIAFLTNVILFSIGMYMNADLIAVGTGLSLLNTPIYVYIFGETMRKSDTN